MRRGPARVGRRRWLPVGLAILVLLSGTLAPVLQDEAARAVGARRVGAGLAPGRVNRLPGSLPAAQLTEEPDPSGAYPPYPLNHAFDAYPRLVGSPPTNFGF